MALGRSTRTLRRTALAFTGVAVGILVVGVALALVTIQFTGTVSSNEFIPPTTTSTTTTLPPGEGLEAGLVNGPADCVPGIPTGVETLGAGSFDLNNTSAQLPDDPSLLCARNAGPGDITTLMLTATSSSDEDVGCSDAEASVDPDGAGCGLAGELDEILLVALQPDPSSTDSNCMATGPIQMALGSQVNLLTVSGGDPSGAFQDGAGCMWRIRLTLDPGATVEQKLAASTDTAELTFTISGSA